MNVITRFLHSPNMFALAKDQILFQEGQPAEVMYVLLEGTVDVLIGGTVVESASAGAVLGEMAVIDGSPRSATAISRTPCRLVSMTAAQFDAFVYETPAFARFVMQVLSGRLRRMNERLLEAFSEVSVR
jgi:CRP-like cAMP-binding protein